MQAAYSTFVTGLQDKQIYMAVCTTYMIVCVCDTLHIQTFLNKVTWLLLRSDYIYHQF